MSQMHSEAEVAPGAAVVPLPQLLHVDVDSESLNLPKGHTWQPGVVAAKSRRQPLPAPQDGHWKMHSTTRSHDSHTSLESGSYCQPEEVYLKATFDPQPPGPICHTCPELREYK